MRALAMESLDGFLEEAAGIVARALSGRLCRVVALDPGGWCLVLKAEGRDGGRISAVRGPVPEPLRGGGAVAEVRAGGEVYGVLGLQVFGGRGLEHGEVRFLEEAAAIIGAAVERVRWEQRRFGEERERFGRAEQRLRFLSEASALLAAAPDYISTLTTAARMAVPALADWCFVDVIEEGGGAHRLVVAHSEAGGEDLAASFRNSYPFREDAPHASPRVLRTGRAELLSAIDDGLLRRLARSEEHLEMMRRLGPRAGHLERGRPSGLRQRAVCEERTPPGRDRVAGRPVDHLRWKATDGPAASVEEPRLARERFAVLDDTDDEAVALAESPGRQNQDITRMPEDLRDLPA